MEKNILWFSVRLSGSFLLAAFLSGCAVPVGMYTHAPEVLWQAPCDFEEPVVAPSRYSGPPFVIKRFENQSRVPVGGLFLVGNTKREMPLEAHTSGLSCESLAQSYAPCVDLAVPVYEAACAALARAGYPVWKDYRPETEAFVRPQGVAECRFVTGRVVSMELATFLASETHDGVTMTILLSVLDKDGKALQETEAVLLAKIRRDGKTDVMRLLGCKLAVQIADMLAQTGVQS